MTYSQKQVAFSKRQKAAALILALGRAKTDPFGFWLRSVTPSWHWDWGYQAFIRTYLAAVTTGYTKRLMLFIPPRHGKSEMVTVRYPVYRMEENPGLRIIVGAYNQTLADKFSRKSRRIAQVRGLELSKERYAVEDWETAQGGGMRAIGVGGGITGQGGDLIIIDDPVKNREEAGSKVYRNRVYDWYTDDLYTRLEPGASMILIMTRWHEDDLAGRILASEDGPNWDVIKLPAEAEDDDPLGREPGQALCPERYDLAALQQIHRVLGRSYYALYQQRPQEQEGDFFKRSWFELAREAPAEAERVRYWDFASTKGDGDYTVGCLMAKNASGLYYLEDIVRGQWSTGERDKIILQTAQLDREKYPNIHVWFEQQPGSAGVDAAQAMLRLLSGYSVHADRVTGDKAMRAEPFASQAEAGNVKVRLALWTETFLDELSMFPNGTHDDQVDAAGGAFNKLSVGSGWLDWMKRRIPESGQEGKGFDW